MKVKSKPKPKIQSSTPLPTPPDEEFSFAIAKVAVSQICESVGFKSTAIPAVQTLTVVATKYLQSIANSTVSYSAAANRTQSNLFDLINALHDHLRPVHGFAGASNLHRTDFCLIKSSVLLELSNFVKNTDEVPFAKPIPRPENSARKSIPAPAPRPPHIPKWLPELPIVSSGEGSSSDDRRNGEKLWENSCSAEKIDGIVIEKGNNERVILEIGAKREKVFGHTQLLIEWKFTSKAIMDWMVTLEETLLVGNDLMMGQPSPIIPPETASQFSCHWRKKEMA